MSVAARKSQAGRTRRNARPPLDHDPDAGPPYSVATATIADDAGVGIGFFAIFLIIWFAIIIGSLVLMIVALVDIARRPDWQWKLAGQEKIPWPLLVILVNLLAIPSLMYWFNIRKKLQAVDPDWWDGAQWTNHTSDAGPPST